MVSRALTDTESRYSNIERECLAVVFGLEKFEYYLYGRKVTVETDHSLLEQIFKKNIAEAPARLQRLLLRCMKFDITVRYKAGKSIPVADALSRVCFKTEADVHRAGADLNKAGADVIKEIHFITTELPPRGKCCEGRKCTQLQDQHRYYIFKCLPDPARSMTKTVQRSVPFQYHAKYCAESTQETVPFEYHTQYHAETVQRTVPF